MKIILAALSSVPILIACASTPNVDLQYYHAKTEIDVEVTRTLACQGNELVEASVAEITTKHIADRSNPASINPAKLAGWFADSNMTLELHPDGRLKGINTSSTGKGGEIIKSAASLATSLAGLAFDGGGAPDMKDVCDAIAQLNPPALKKDGDGAAKSKHPTAIIIYEGKMTVEPKKHQSAQLKPSAKSIPTRTKLNDILTGRYSLDDYIGTLSLYLSIKNLAEEEPCNAQRERIIIECPTPHNLATPPHLELQKTQIGTTYIEADNGKGYNVTLSEGEDIIVAGTEPYYLPIPKAKLFGGNEFELAIDESGAVTKVGYKTTSGANAAIGAGSTIQSATSGSTYLEKAAAAKAKADLLAHERRIAVCQTSPEDCK